MEFPCSCNLDRTWIRIFNGLNKMKKKQSFFEKRSVVAVFGILALFVGASFVQQSVGGVTGNIVNAKGGSLFSLAMPMIGILLLICSIVLIAYSVVKKE